MNDWNDSNESEGMKNMRKQLKKLSEQVAAFEAEKATWQNTNRSAVLQTALVSRGLDAKVAKFYPSDLGTDDESVNRWYEENKDVFGKVQPVTQTNSNENDTTLSDMERRGYEAMQAMEAYDARVVQDFKSQLDQIKMKDPYDSERATAELMDLLRANGVNIVNG
jgi:spore germination protein YaaH